MTTNEFQDTARAYVAAYGRGEAAARGLKIGDVFTGAFGAAQMAGYADRGSMEYRAFSSGFLDGLRATRGNGVVVDADNRIAA